jgi:hypothetical protein
MAVKEATLFNRIAHGFEHHLDKERLELLRNLIDRIVGV